MQVSPITTYKAQIPESVNVSVFTDGHTDALTSVRTGASQSFQPEIARRNKQQMLVVGVEAIRSACREAHRAFRESRSAKRNIFTVVGAYIQQQPAFGQLKGNC